MNYIQVNISFPAPTEEFNEILTAELADLGYESFLETDEGLLAYIPKSDYKKNILLSLKERYKDTIGFTFDTEVIKQKNWNAEWESNYQPINVDDICLVKAPFHSIEGNFDYHITIEPKMSFGTGHHETTYLMIKMMLDMDFQDKVVLDMGCGTGILAILAAMKNAGKVTAIDIDTWAFENTLENAVKNDISIINAIKGDATVIPNETYDVILANINRNILLEDVPNYTNHLKPSGILLISGIYQEDLHIIITKTDACHLKYDSFLEKNNWVAAKFIKN